MDASERITGKNMAKKWESVLLKALRLAQSVSGIVGVDYGFVYKNGKRLKTQGIRFHVRKKVPPSEWPATAVIPKQLDALRCDVVQARYSLQANPKGICNPIEPGVSVGNLSRLRTGTLGMFVLDTVNQKPAVLSNWHVLGGAIHAKSGDEICQPGPLHTGTMPPRIVGKLERWAPLDTGCDAAIALLSNGATKDQKLFDDTTVIRGVEPPQNGMKLIKYGVNSHLTHGMVDGIGGSFQMDYSDYGDTRRWIDGIRIVADPEFPESEISLAGDSGSVWVNRATNNAVALHFAGEDGLGPTAEYALAQPLPRVFSLLGVDIEN
jgi:hypothetical protein